MVAVVRGCPCGRRGVARRRGWIDHLADRPERRRQVDALQHRLGLPPRGRGHGRVRRQADRPAAAPPHRPLGARADVPDGARARPDDRAGQRRPRRAAAARRAPPPERRRRGRDPAPRARGPRSRTRAARTRPARPPCERARGDALRRGAQAARLRPHADDRATARAARRADGRRQPGTSGRSARARRLAARVARGDGAAGRARPGGRDGASATGSSSWRRAL